MYTATYLQKCSECIIYNKTFLSRLRKLSIKYIYTIQVYIAIELMFTKSLWHVFGTNYVTIFLPWSHYLQPSPTCPMTV